MKKVPNSNDSALTDPTLESRVFTDPSFPSAFQALQKPFKIIPQRCTNGQVEFLVEGKGIDKALDEIYANTPVGVLDFIRYMKGMRSSIFALKGGQR